MRIVSKERAAKRREYAAVRMRELSDNFSSSKNQTIENALSEIAEVLVILLEEKS